MARPVYIVATAARTPLGRTAETAAAAVRAGISRLQACEFVLGPGVPLTAAFDASLPLDLPLGERMLALAGPAMHSILTDLGAGALSAVPLLLGLPEPRPEFAHDDGLVLAESLVRTAAVPVHAEPLMLGHAAVLEAIRCAVASIEHGDHELIVVGGVDSYLQRQTLDWLEASGRLARPGRRTGFLPGEGAGFLALASAEAYRRRRWTQLAVVRAVASAREPWRRDSDAENLGEGLTAAVSQALAGLPADAIIDDIYTDINGERYRAEEWGFTALRLGGRLPDASMYHTAVAGWGDVGAATGALNVILGLRAWARGYARGNRMLVLGSSETGLRAAAVLERMH